MSHGTPGANICSQRATRASDKLGLSLPGTPPRFEKDHSTCQCGIAGIAGINISNIIYFIIFPCRNTSWIITHLSIDFYLIQFNSRYSNSFAFYSSICLCMQQCRHCSVPFPLPGLLSVVSYPVGVHNSGAPFVCPSFPSCGLLLDRTICLIQMIFVDESDRILSWLIYPSVIIPSYLTSSYP